MISILCIILGFCSIFLAESIITLLLLDLWTNSDK